MAKKVAKKKTKKKRRKTPLTETLYSTITSTLRGKLWRWSPEKKAVVKRAGGRCEMCGKEVTGYGAIGHHIVPVDFRRIERVLREELLVAVEGLLLLCRGCHHEVHHGKKGKDNE